MPGRPVFLVVADVAEQGVGGPSEGGQVGRLCHVVVVNRPSRAPSRSGTAPGAWGFRPLPTTSRHPGHSGGLPGGPGSHRSPHVPTARPSSWRSGSRHAAVPGLRRSAPAAWSAVPSTMASIRESVRSGATSLVQGSWRAGPNCSSVWRIPWSPPARWKVRLVPIPAQRRPGP